MRDSAWSGAWIAIANRCLHIFPTLTTCSKSGHFMPTLNSLAVADQATLTPSRRDGVPLSLEEELCVFGCQQIQQAGTLLRLPQAAMSIAQVLFRRFWYVSSMKQFSVRDTSKGALLLASKLAEVPLRLRDLLLVFDYLTQRACHRAQFSHATTAPTFEYIPPSYHSQSVYDDRDSLVVAEMQILKRLGFQVQVNLPYALMINYLQVMGVADAQLSSNTDASYAPASQYAWNYLSDALQTPVYCLFPPHVIACTSIYLLTLSPNPLHEPLVLPLEPEPWWELFDATRGELRAVASHIVRLYDTTTASEAPREGLGMSTRVQEIRGGLVTLSTRSGLREALEH